MSKRQSDDVTALCSTSSQQSVDVPDTVSAVDSCCTNVERAERELFQPRPRPGGLVFITGGLPLRPLPPSLFPNKRPPPFTQFQVFSTQSGSCLRSSDVLGAALPPRLDFSIVDTFAYSRVPSEHSSSPRFGSHVFHGGDVPTNICYRRHDCRGKRFRFVGVHHRQSMLLAGLHCQHRRVLASIDVMKEN